MTRHQERHRLLVERASDLAEVALANIGREYPNDLRHPMSGPRDRPLPREVHPAFYGSFDWHSCVEMHWLLIRLLRTVPDEIPEQRIRAALDEHLAAEPLAAEAACLADPDRRLYHRPYGWGWALWLIHEAATWEDTDARRWTANLTSLADVLTAPRRPAAGDPVHPGHRLRLHRRLHRPPARPQPQSRLVLAPARRNTPRHRPAHPAHARGGPPAHRRGARPGHRWPLRRRTLARLLRRPPPHLSALTRAGRSADGHPS
jgi:Protein of unknown function (DUF2891)